MTIDIITMRAEIPCIVGHLLPESNATLAWGCHFRHGVITPMQDYTDQEKTFSIVPQTIFDYWFAWRAIADAICGLVANDDYDRVRQFDVGM